VLNGKFISSNSNCGYVTVVLISDVEFSKLQKTSKSIEGLNGVHLSLSIFLCLSADDSKNGLHGETHQ
jgi:hypothetical protein